MMWYLAWRVIIGLHDKIELNFMLPGHTKFRPDAYFALLKRCYKRQDHIDDIADLAECVRKSGRNVTCVPQLYKDWNIMIGMFFSVNGLHNWLATANITSICLTKAILAS